MYSSCLTFYYESKIGAAKNTKRTNLIIRQRNIRSFIIRLINKHSRIYLVLVCVRIKKSPCGWACEIQVSELQIQLKLFQKQVSFRYRKKEKNTGPSQKTICSFKKFCSKPCRICRRVFLEYPRKRKYPVRVFIENPKKIYCLLVIRRGWFETVCR